MQDVKFEDGTNVIAGTEFSEIIPVTADWYRPSDSKVVHFHQEKWTSLRQRFQAIIDEFRPLECTLVQTRVPAFRRDSIAFDRIFAEEKLIQSGGGLSREVSQLFGKESQPLFGSFPIHDANGKPICNTANEPFALQFGLFRQFFVSEGPTYSGETRPFPGPRLMELARDASQFLYDLPARVATSVWRNWIGGFSRGRNADEYFWLDALFELSWQSQVGSALHSKRYAWRGNGSVELIGNGLFPRLPNASFIQKLEPIAHENGYPMAWYAKLHDIARASAAAIDELLLRGKPDEAVPVPVEMREAVHGMC
jgi:hypothetical protein